MCLHHLLHRGSPLKVTQRSDAGSPQSLLVAWLLRACIVLQLRGLYKLEGRRLLHQLLKLCCLRAFRRQGRQDLGGQVPRLKCEQLLRLCAGGGL